LNADLVPDPERHGQLFLIAAFGLRRVVEPEMGATHIAEKERAGLVGRITQDILADPKEGLSD
jgi:hypothetical protein